MKRLPHHHPILALFALPALGGCTGISVAPSCPNELAVGASAPLLANEFNPGAIAEYAWEVIPPQLGKVTDPTKPSTMFEATSEGDAVIRLTASDGLYQVISQCQIRVAGTAEPPPDDSDNSNSNDNANTNDNTSDNANDNDTGNDNTADNTNDNTGDDKGDNTNDNGGRPGGVRKTSPPHPR